MWWSLIYSTIKQFHIGQESLKSHDGCLLLTISCSPSLFGHSFTWLFGLAHSDLWQCLLSVMGASMHRRFQNRASSTPAASNQLARFSVSSLPQSRGQASKMGALFALTVEWITKLKNQLSHNRCGFFAEPKCTKIAAGDFRGFGSGSLSRHPHRIRWCTLGQHGVYSLVHPHSDLGFHRIGLNGIRADN